VSATRIVFDASVVLAAVLTPNRRSASCLLVEAVGTGALILVVSPPLLAEYRRTVEERRSDAQIKDPLGLVLDLAAAAELVEPVPVQAVKADPSDDVYLGTALAGRAAYLATFDRRRLLPLDPFKGVRVVTPGDVLRDLRGRR
jgi:predicted nucleic acid-binding protein